MSVSTQECGVVRDVLSRVGDKWTIVTIVTLGEGPLRFGELLRRGHGISQRMLTQTLRNLERDGLVWRKATPTVPLTMEYGLTPLGESLMRVLKPFFDWCGESAEAIAASRELFDAKPD